MVMEIKFQPQGVCSKQIVIDVEDGIVNNVKFIGGCSGNTQGVAKLVEGMPAKEVIARWRESSVDADLLHAQTSLPLL